MNVYCKLENKLAMFHVDTTSVPIARGTVLQLLAETNEQPQGAVLVVVE